MSNEELVKLQKTAAEQWERSNLLEMDHRGPMWPMVMVLCEIALRLLPPLE